MQDFAGHTPAAPPVAPRNGQWCLIKLADAERQTALVKEGACEASGYLVCIYRAAHTPAPVTITKDGKTTTVGGESVPAMLVLVTPTGHNLSVGVRDEKGHVEVRDVFFFPDSPAIAERLPATSASHLPPGRVFNSRWLEVFHGQTKHPMTQAMHGTANGEMTAAKFLQHQAAILQE